MNTKEHKIEVYANIIEDGYQTRCILIATSIWKEKPTLSLKIEGYHTLPKFFVKGKEAEHGYLNRKDEYKFHSSTSGAYIEIQESESKQIFDSYIKSIK